MRNFTTNLIVLFAVSIFLFTSCPDNLQLPEKLKLPEIELEEGKGAISIYIDEPSSRTILPQNTDWSSFTGLFQITVVGHTTVMRSISNLSTPIQLDAGNYTVNVFAMRDGDVTIAKGQINITVIAGEPAAHIIRLSAILEAGTTGTFGWNVTIPAAASGEMRITEIDGTFVGTEDLTQGTNNGSRDLNSDYYFVTTTLTKTGRVDIIRRDVLHIYQNMTSVFEIEFTDALFNNSLHYVTFDFNYGGFNEMQPVIHGELIAQLSPDPQRAGFGFAGWFTEAAAVNAFNFSEPVLDDITLYAGWIPNTASITLTVAQIENGDPIFTAFTTPIVVSRNGFGAPAVFNVSVQNAGNYSYFKWEIAGVGLMPAVVSEGAATSSFTINGANPNYGTPGGHVIKLTVTRNGILYQVNIPFTIIDTTAPVELDANGIITSHSDLTSAFTAIGTTAGSFTVTLRTNQTLGARILDTANQHITLIGDTNERTIQYNGATGSRMFMLQNAATSLTLGNNITLVGISESTMQLIYVQNGTLTMNNGSKITGHSTSMDVIVIEGTNSRFIMNGGAITGNTTTWTGGSELSGGIFVNASGTATITGGSITGNSPVDIFIKMQATLNLSGNAAIGNLRLNAESAVANAAINLGTFNGTVGTINLRGDNSTMNTAISWWAGKQVIQAAAGYTLTAADIAKFPLGNFYSATVGAENAISPAYAIAGTMSDMGRLIAVTVNVTSGGSTLGYADLTAALNEIGTQAGDYTITLLANQTLGARTLSTANQNITLIGSGIERQILLSQNGTMFTVNNSALTLGANITLVGRSAGGNGNANNNNSLVRVTNGARFTMLDGSMITGNHSTATTDDNGRGAAVHLTGTNSTFTMKGGEITGNTASGTNTTSGNVNYNAGGLFAQNGTNVYLEGGSISGNTGFNGDVLTLSSITLSGNAHIAHSTITATENFMGTLIINANWTGTINKFDMRRSVATISNVINNWLGQPVLQAASGHTLTTTQIGNITLGDFVTGSNTILRQPISDTHLIGTSGADLGRLISKYGLGTEAAPFLIYNETDLRAVGRGLYYDMDWSLAAHYKLMNNITITNHWYAIGPFTGSFDGNFKTISNLIILRTTFSDQGMFSTISASGIAKNIGLVNVDIEGGNATGGIVGTNSGTVENCFVTGTVSHADADFVPPVSNESGGQTGGIVGMNNSGAIVKNSYFNGSVTGRQRVGGIVGSNGGFIQNCYALGNVKGHRRVGGITGYHGGTTTGVNNRIVENSYAANTVRGTGDPSATSVGGITGVNQNATVRNSIVLNESLISDIDPAGLFGRVTGSAASTTAVHSNNRAWINMSAIANSVPKTNVSDLAGMDGLDVTAAALKTQATWQTSGAAFNFGTSDAAPWVWQDGKMPRLHWETSSRDWPSYLTD